MCIDCNGTGVIITEVDPYDSSKDIKEDCETCKNNSEDE